MDVVERATAVGGTPTPDVGGRSRRLTLHRTASFSAAAGLVVLYAMRGGSFDIVVRQELGLGLWWVVALGWATGVLPRGRAARRELPIMGAIAVLALWTVLSLLWTSSSERTFDEFVRVVDYAGLVAVVASLADRSTWRAAAAGILAGAGIVAGISVAHHLDPTAFQRDYVAALFGGHRESYPLNYWNGVGAWGTMTAAAALAWSAHARTAIGRALALAVVPVAATCAYFSFSRAAIGGAVLAVIAVVVLGPRRILVAVHVAIGAAATAVVIAVIRKAPEIENGSGTAGAGRVALVLAAAALACAGAAVLTRRLARRWGYKIPGVTPLRTLIAACVAGAIVVAALAPSVGRRAWNEFRHASAPVSQTADPAARLNSLASLRYTVWQDAIDAAQHKPVLGIGAGTFQYWHDRRGRDVSFLRDGHSLYIESLAELGIPGLLAVLALVASVLFVALRARARLTRASDRGAAGALIASFVVFLWQAGVDWMWELTAVGALALGGTALLAAADGRTVRTRVRPAWPLRTGVAIVAVVAGLVQLPGIVSTTYERRSSGALASDDFGRALADANHAVSAEPWSTSALVQRAVVEETTGDLPSARADLLRAIDREPQDWSHELQLSRVEAKLGDARAALVAYRAARRLRPRAWVFSQPLSAP
jgi:hypothetical protein